MTLPPGVLSECYRLRWRIEKAFNQPEQKLDERQASELLSREHEFATNTICQ